MTARTKNLRSIVVAALAIMGAGVRQGRLLAWTPADADAAFNSFNAAFGSGFQSNRFYKDTSEAADLANPTPTCNGVSFQLGPMIESAKNVVRCQGQTIPLLPGACSAIWLLGSATGGDQTGRFQINYADGSASSENITEKDWCARDVAGQCVVQTMLHRHRPTADEKINTYIFGYRLTPTPGKGVASLGLPANPHMHVLAISRVTAAGKTEIVDLASCYNQDGFSFDAYRKDGDYDGLGNTYSGGPDFWKNAEMLEMIEDACERSGNSAYKTMLGDFYNGFCANMGSNWMLNKYNDDIMWMVIACIRAYEITGDKKYLDQAQRHFDQVYERGCDAALGGGIWWSIDKRQKNSCINSPAVIAACKFFQILGDRSYLARAQSLYAWQSGTLFDAGTGAVWDSIRRDGHTINKTTLTYNQGTFIGASALLYKATGTRGYFDNARKALDFTKDHMTSHGILKSEPFSADLGGFKGIFCRWAFKFVKDNELAPAYLPWFQANAEAAWSHKDSRGLMDENWSQPTGSGALNAWWCSGAVVLMQVCPPDGPIAPSTPPEHPTSSPVINP